MQVWVGSCKIERFAKHAAWEGNITPRLPKLGKQLACCVLNRTWTARFQWKSRLQCTCEGAEDQNVGTMGKESAGAGRKPAASTGGRRRESGVAAQLDRGERAPLMGGIAPGPLHKGGWLAPPGWSETCRALWQGGQECVSGARSGPGEQEGEWGPCDREGGRVSGAWTTLL